VEYAQSYVAENSWILAVHTLGVLELELLLLGVELLLLVELLELVLEELLVELLELEVEELDVELDEVLLEELVLEDDVEELLLEVLDELDDGGKSSQTHR